MTRYFVYDTFTDRHFGGNPLAILPDAHELQEADLQRIAREFNYSETVFLDLNDPAVNRMRIFTPTQEVPFAGHPLIGTAVALADEGLGPDLHLTLTSSVIQATAEGGRASFFRVAPLEVLHRPDPAMVARCLSLPTKSVIDATMASVGLPFCLVELLSPQCLDAILTDIDAFRRAQAAYPSDFDFAIYAYNRENEQFRARMFAPLDNIPEDPATGSAAAALGALLFQRDGRTSPFQIEQGVAMGRPSRIGVTANAEGVRIEGQAVRIMEGRLTL